MNPVDDTQYVTQLAQFLSLIHISPEDIVITSFRQTEVQPETIQPEKKENEPEGIVWNRDLLFLAGAGGLLLLLLLFLFIHRYRKHTREDDAMFAQAENQRNAASVLERAGEEAVVNSIGTCLLYTS